MEQIDLNELCGAVNGTTVGNLPSLINSQGVSIDTREDMKGKIFIPLKGQRDGHDFLHTAFEKGALFAFSENECKYPHIRVKNTFSAIKSFAKFYKDKFSVTTVGITGSAGKTTTKDVTSSILSMALPTLKTQGNFNNEIGLPLTIFNLNHSYKACVLEMGMNNFGEISNLANIARPNVAIITDIGVAHIENLGTRENILKAKLEILDYKPNEVIFDGDNDMLAKLKGKVSAKYYYLNKPNEDYTAYNIIYNGLHGSTATIKILGDVFNVSIPVPGEPIVRCVLAGAIVGKLFGLSNKQIQQGVQNFKLSKNRIDIIYGNKLTIINDTYNASPNTMKAMLNLLASEKGKKIAILGDMYELGSFSEELHKELGEYDKISNIDMLICIGDMAINIYNAAKSTTINKSNIFYFKTKEEFFESGIISGFDVATVLLKASRGMAFEEITKYLQ